MVYGIEHSAIAAKDSKALCEWYNETFGTKTVYDNGKGTYFVAFENGDMIEIISAETEKPEDTEKMQGIRHLALSVTSEAFDELVPVLKAEPRVSEVHDVSENANGLKTYWFRDIEGNFMHLIYRPNPLV
ncbi:MAG: VOC family protein [Clostridia bacterium]|nr:VOC family protein [Clostridia bacterium]